MKTYDEEESIIIRQGKTNSDVDENDQVAEQIKLQIPDALFD